MSTPFRIAYFSRKSWITFAEKRTRFIQDHNEGEFPSVAEALDEDRGRYIGFVRLVGFRKEGGGKLDLYDPEAIAREMGNGD